MKPRTKSLLDDLPATEITRLFKPHDDYDRVRELAGQAGLSPLDPVVTPLAEARAAYESYYRFFAARSGKDVARVQDLTVGPELPIRLYHPPPGRRLPVIVYFHGGGYVLNSLDTHDGVMRWLAAESGLPVVGLDYARAPEHRLPHQVHQAVDLARWLAQDGAAYGLDGARTAYVGDSAGAHLALCGALAVRDGGGVLPRSLVLAYGMYDRAQETRSHRLFGGGAFGLTSRRMAWFWDQCLDERPLVAQAQLPLLQDLRGLPPVTLLAAQLDPLRDDSTLLAERLKRSGVPCDLTIHDGLMHAFLQFAPVLSPAAAVLDGMAARLRADLLGGTP